MLLVITGAMIFIKGNKDFGDALLIIGACILLPSIVLAIRGTR